MVWTTPYNNNNHKNNRKITSHVNVVNITRRFFYIHSCFFLVWLFSSLTNPFCCCYLWHMKCTTWHPKTRTKKQLIIINVLSVCCCCCCCRCFCESTDWMLQQQITIAAVRTTTKQYTTIPDRHTDRQTDHHAVFTECSHIKHWLHHSLCLAIDAGQ